MLVAVITFFYYFTELNQHARHLFYQGLYFLPIMLAGFWLGLRGVLTTSLSITVLNLPFTFIHWKGFSIGDFNNIMEMVLYNAVALVLGVLRNREQVHQKRLREVEELAVRRNLHSILHY
jgi:two-component system, NtrC family, sensor histidine kinase HydH